MGYSTSWVVILYDVLPSNLGPDTELHYQKAIVGEDTHGNSLTANF